MRPTTDTIPKALIPVRGRPFVDMQLEWLRGHGVDQVVFSIGFMGDLIRRHVGDGSRLGIRVEYVDEGDRLRGTGGAVRLVVDSGLVGKAFTVLYGDSYLTLDLPEVEQAFVASGLPALMTVLRNDDRWDRSNVVVRDGKVSLYDKTRPPDGRAEMKWIDYGLSILRDDVIRKAIVEGEAGDLGNVMRDLSAAGRLAAFEVTERFFEIGSPEGLADLEAFLSTR